MNIKNFLEENKNENILILPENEICSISADFKACTILSNCVHNIFPKERTYFVGQANEETFPNLRHEDRNLDPEYPIIGLKLGSNARCKSVEQFLHNFGYRWARTDKEEKFVGSNHGANKDNNDPASDICYVAVSM